MSARKVLIPLLRDEIHPRFDMAIEALVAEIDDEGGRSQRILVLPYASPEELCDLVVRERVDTVICGGLEEEHYHYLRWKRVDVIDGVAGLAADALDRFAAGNLRAGDILFAVAGA